MEIFRANDIVKNYSNHKALDKVSIFVQERSIFGLLGPNGAGKTTLLRIINQITAYDSGELFFEGEPLKPEHIEQIGYLPEERGLYKKMKVGEQVLYFAQLKGLKKSDALKRAKEWFEKFEITAWWNKKVEELSKGMQQKVQFIITAIHQPKLLIFDEPFTGFDPININLIKHEILKLRDQGATVIFSTHDMPSVEELCDHIALINKSKKILDGSVKEIRKTYKSNTYKIDFEGDINALTNTLNNNFKIIDQQKEDEIFKLTVKIENNQTQNDLLQAIMPFGQIYSFNEIIPSMSDIFIQKVTESHAHTNY